MTKHETKGVMIMRILTLLAPGFEEIEAVTVIDILRRAGFDVVTASVAEKVVTGSHRIPLIADTMLDDVAMDGFTALYLPGGQPGTRNLAADERVIGLIKTFHTQKRYIAAICAAPTILLTADILKKRRITSYPSERDKFDPGFYRDEEVVRDGHIITGRGVGTALPFALKLVELWSGKESAEKLAGKIVFKTGV